MLSKSCVFTDEEEGMLVSVCDIQITMVNVNGLVNYLSDYLRVSNVSLSVLDLNRLLSCFTLM